MITIVDYGMGNLGSIQNMLKKVGFKSVISGRISDIQKAEKLILPGVGAFDNGIENIKKRKILDLLNDEVLKHKKPVLGICLGMQLMTKKSEEGKLPGLGWIKAETVKFTFNPENGLKIPHMGWNSVKFKKKSLLAEDAYEDSRFYFVHSFHAVCRESQDVLMVTHYGYDFCSAFQKNNIYGVQFHPEKSHQYGMKLLENFAKGI